MPHSKRTWILIADTARARILLHDRPGDEIGAVEGAVFDNPGAHGHTRDLGTDKPPRSFESVRGARHAQEPRLDFHRQAKSDFARQIADYIEQAAREKKFNELMLVAPPRLLGDLRAALGKLGAESVVGTLAKDLTKLPAAELVERVRTLVRS